MLLSCLIYSTTYGEGKEFGVSYGASGDILEIQSLCSYGFWLSFFFSFFLFFLLRRPLLSPIIATHYRSSSAGVFRPQKLRLWQMGKLTIDRRGEDTLHRGEEITNFLDTLPIGRGDVRDRREKGTNLPDSTFSPLSLPRSVLERLHSEYN